MKNIKILSIIIIGLLTACGKKVQETKPIRKDVTETVFASGNLEANQIYQLVAQSDGYLIELNFKENEIVNQGQVLAVIDNKQNEINKESANALYNIAQQNLQPNAPQLVQAKIAVENAKQKLNFDEAQAQRLKKLWEANSISKVDYETATLKFQTSKADYSKASENYNLIKQQAEQQLVINNAQKNANTVLLGFNQIKAVYTGKVYQRYKEKGDFVRKGDVIATIGNADFLYAKVSIDESSISQVKVGQEAVIQLNTNKKKTYKGKVAEILPAFNEQTQSFLCKIHFTDSLDFNILNTQLQVNIITGTTKKALLIPRNYLQYGNLVTIKGEKEPIKIETKFISTDWVQVLAGLDENTTIITDKIK
ncbi:MAG: HlyD family efflux transporter periplasmic adaptor subunit [Cytophagales bacterium]|nr:MAG: HlyD family efflux transporter periplasmic adaptor subunit [Cytophagales bacterium]